MRHIADGITVRVNPDHRMTEGLDVSRVPVFSVGEAAKVFFGRKSDWLRWRERRGDLGDISPRSQHGNRSYTLRDIEGMVHELAKRGAIDGLQAATALAVVAAQLVVWGYHCRHMLPAEGCELCDIERIQHAIR